MAKVIILESAQEEIENIGTIYLQLSGPNASRNMVNKIYGALEKLEAFPRLGFLPADPFIQNQGYRYLIVEKYICIYRPEGEKVYVYHIADIRSDYPRLFRRLMTTKDKDHDNH